MTVLKTLRQTDIDTKVLILSARCEVADKVLGLDEGANAVSYTHLLVGFKICFIKYRVKSFQQQN